MFNQEVVLPDEEGDMSDFFESTEEEGERILSSSKWIPVIPNCNRSSHDFEAAWRKVEGTRLVFARSLSRFPNVDADALFAFIGSPHGFEMIDPATKNHGTCCVRNYSPPDRMLHTNTKITLDHSKTHFDFFGLAPRQFQTVRNTSETASRNSFALRAAPPPLLQWMIQGSLATRLISSGVALWRVEGLSLSKLLGSI